MTTDNTREGIPLIPEGITFPTLSKFSGATGKVKVEEYTERIKKYNEKARSTLNIFSFNDNEVRGSNLFANVELVSECIALPSELEHAVRLNSSYFRNTYEDMGLVIRTDGDSITRNDYVAKYLAEQLKKRGIEFPARVSLRGLTLKEDDNSLYGLVFLIGDSAEVLHLPKFAHENNKRSFSRTDERGVPLFDESGDRTFYTRKDGISRLYLSRDLNLYSSDENLADSGGNGRVVIVGGEAAGADLVREYTAKENANLSALKEKLNTQHRQHTEEIDALAQRLKLG